jgi:uncharacterized protein (DUF433 family)
MLAVIVSRGQYVAIHADNRRSPTNGGVPRIRGLGIPVSTVVNMLADGMTDAEILAAYPGIEADDTLRYVADAVWAPNA